MHTQKKFEKCMKQKKKNAKSFKPIIGGEYRLFFLGSRRDQLFCDGVRIDLIYTILRLTFFLWIVLFYVSLLLRKFFYAQLKKKTTQVDHQM